MHDGRDVSISHLENNETAIFCFSLLLYLTHSQSTETHLKNGQLYNRRLERHFDLPGKKFAMS